MRDRIAAIVMAVLAVSGIVCAVLVGSGGGLPSMAMSKRPAAATVEGSVPEKPDDMALGDVNAPIQIVEYASLACSHCAVMDQVVFPKLKAKYIDTGKVRFIYRDFPLRMEDGNWNPYATAAAVLARCRGKEHYFDSISVLFELQAWWLFGATDGADANNRLASVMIDTGMSKDEVDRCLQDQDLRAYVEQEANEAEKKLSVRSTPTFIINGESYAGELPFYRFEKILAPLMPKS